MSHKAKIMSDIKKCINESIQYYNTNNNVI